MIEIPQTFVDTTIGREGERGAKWLATLPKLLARLTERWDCVLDGPVMHGGVGVIVPVRRGRTPAVLKVSFPHPGNVAEPLAFAAWRGRGAVLLYERADESFAMLLERAGPHTLAEVRDHDEVVRTAARLGHRLAVPAPSAELPRLSARVPEWERSLSRDAADFPDALAPRVVQAALATVRELGRDQPELMVHGDLHPRNILAGQREPWLAVDPKGFVGDPAYDGGMLLKARLFALLEQDDPDRAALRSLAVFAEAGELDPERVRRWGQFHAVDSAFWIRRHGLLRARSGPELAGLTRLADHFAQLLTL